MTRTFGVFAAGALLAVLCEGAAFAQATVEAGMATAGAATATAPVARGIGSSMSGIAGSLNKAVSAAGASNGAPAAASSTAPASKTTRSKATLAKTTAATPPAPAAPPKVYEDPLNIKAGLSYDDLISRFGPPSMEFSSGNDSRTLTYAVKAGAIQVECQGGKVASVAKPNS